MNLARLKMETAEEHARLEGLVPLMSATLGQVQYCAVLRRFYGFIKSWEVWSEINAPEGLRPMLAERQRSGLIEADLRYFGDEPPKFDYASPAEETSRAAFLGAMYVIEGSTLGGQYIARHVEGVFRLMPSQGDSYFRGYGDRTGSMWRQFQDVLEAVPDNDGDEVIKSARKMFSAFGEWMRYLESSESSASASAAAHRH